MKRFHLRLSLSLRTQQLLAWLLLLTIMVVYSIWMSDQALLRYTTFRADAFDLGNMDQAFWNTIHGRPFQFTNQGSDNYGPPTRLATHVEPIILPLSLLYIFHGDARILLVFQTLALMAGALPVFMLTRKHLPSFPLLAPVMAASYLFAPALLGLNIFDFHPVSMAAPLLLYAVWAMEQRKHVWFIITCLLACACKEDIPLAVALLAILAIWKFRMRWTGSILALIGLLWTAIAFTVVIPRFFPGAQHSNYWYRYEALGSSPSAAIVNVLLHPWLPFTIFLTLDRIYYLFSLLRSSGFLALLAPEWLLPILPSLAVNILADGFAYNSGVYHYNAAIVPFVVIASIHGLRRFLQLWAGWREETLEGPPAIQKPLKETAHLPGVQIIVQLGRQGWLVLVGTGKRLWRVSRLSESGPFWRERRQSMRLRFAELARYCSLSIMYVVLIVWIVGMTMLNYSILTPRLNIFWATHSPGLHEQQIEQLLTMIPADASVSAGGNLNPHLTDRRYITVFPEITFLTSEPGVSNTVEYVIVDLDTLSPEDTNRSANFVDVLNQLQRSHQYKLVAQADGVILLKKAS
ncbi:DUF2079 domain-containing protein [Tengunoibacter tsumagoiensis]|uniref:DUF2079 domain-containing protein n=1 Tax=Tengunoibacter tsumagoiensis TaxID=2014871 RepID=A0A401ZVT3_9CHLR|nr:DUF2079 domain-containing protein [Tengunoibacter tsumagoiensis]GCE11013.1 hypothetical protein KTT_08720 [Tengunoibacter tsumagoiensis]